MNDGMEFLYVILESSGQCSVLKDGGAERIDGIPGLLKDGWRPLRETPFSDSGSAKPCILAVFERDNRDPRGFGFRP